MEINDKKPFPYERFKKYVDGLNQCKLEKDLLHKEIERLKQEGKASKTSGEAG